jgi:hypothetical protein
MEKEMNNENYFENLEKIIKTEKKENDLRDYFAGQALSGIMANSEVEKVYHHIASPGHIYEKAITKLSYEIADAMMEARIK